MDDDTHSCARHSSVQANGGESARRIRGGARWEVAAVEPTWAVARALQQTAPFSIQPGSREQAREVCELGLKEREGGRGNAAVSCRGGRCERREKRTMMLGA